MVDAMAAESPLGGHDLRHVIAGVHDAVGVPKGVHLVIVGPILQRVRIDGATAPGTGWNLVTVEVHILLVYVEVIEKIGGA